MSVTQENVGIVTEEEKNEVLGLYERIMGLKELLPVLEVGNDDPSLYDRAVVDLGATTKKQKEWWNKMANKYKWKGINGGSWHIDFDDNTIHLLYPSS